MDQGTGISTHDLLAWIGAVAFYLVFTLMAIYQWHHPEHVPYKWFPFHEEPGDRTTPKRIRQVRFGTIVSLIALNAMAVMWIVQQCTR